MIYEGGEKKKRREGKGREGKGRGKETIGEKRERRLEQRGVRYVTLTLASIVRSMKLVQFMIGTK